MTQECAVEFVPLLNHKDYEILTVYPFTIRRKDNHYEVKECIHNGYKELNLNDGNGFHSYKKHRLIALQFLPNPDNLPEVDHKNKHKDDNHLENLRWVSGSDNCKNKTSYNGVVCEYIDDIPDESIKVLDYGKHQFENYYYCDNIFYFYNGIQYRKLHINEAKNGSKIVRMIDVDGKSVSVCYTKFKKIYGLD